MLESPSSRVLLSGWGLGPWGSDKAGLASAPPTVVWAPGAHGLRLSV